MWRIIIHHKVKENQLIPLDTTRALRQRQIANIYKLVIHYKLRFHFLWLSRKNVLIMLINTKMYFLCIVSLIANTRQSDLEEIIASRSYISDSPGVYRIQNESPSLPYRSWNLPDTKKESAWVRLLELISALIFGFGGGRGQNFWLCHGL